MLESVDGCRIRCKNGLPRFPLYDLPRPHSPWGSGRAGSAGPSASTSVSGHDGTSDVYERKLLWGSTGAGANVHAGGRLNHYSHQALYVGVLKRR